MGAQPFHMPPAGQPGDYITYAIRAGRDGMVVAACKDVGCQFWAHGWETTVDESTPLGKAQAEYIRDPSDRGAGRTYTEQRTGTGLTVFKFEAFQRCFTEHHTQPDRFLVRDGDWRGNPTQRVRLHANGRDWAEDFQEHEGSLAELREKG